MNIDVHEHLFMNIQNVISPKSTTPERHFPYINFPRASTATYFYFSAKYFFILAKTPPPPPSIGVRKIFFYLPLDFFKKFFEKISKQHERKGTAAAITLHYAKKFLHAFRL